jgi:hypothetical protein
MREAYRKNKRTLYEHILPANIKLAFIVILRGKTVPDFVTIEKSMKEMINKLSVLVKDKKDITNQKPETAGSEPID